MPPFPTGCPTQFRATVHGIAFADRERHLDGLSEGDRLVLMADPPTGTRRPGIWIHLPSGDPIGHLPPEIAAWLWPWLRQGGEAEVRALRVHGSEAPSWRRLMIEVNCEAESAA